MMRVYTYTYLYENRKHYSEYPNVVQCIRRRRRAQTDTRTK